MKRIIALLVVQCFCTVIFAQFGSKGVYSTNRQAVVLDNDSTRKIYGGTVIIPTYVGSGFNSTIRNAFDYACKIWEEQIPTIYPLNIEVRMASLIGDSTLAMVEPKFTLGNLMSPSVNDTENAIIKRYAQFDTGWRGAGASNFIGLTDAVITFNSNKLFSYKTSTNNIDSDKYDFISVAIQAIGKVLGFYMMAYYDGTNLNALNNCNQFTRYVLNNQQSLSYTNTINYINGYSLFRPSVYDSNYSLNYFSINSASNETLFMQPGISTGTAIRYVGKSMQRFFSLLGFEWPITTGMNGTEFEPTSPDDALDYSWGDGDGLNNNGSKVFDRTFSYNNYFNECNENRPEGKYILMANGAWQAYTSLSQINPRDTIYARSFDGYLRLMEVEYIPYGPGWSYTNHVISHKLCKCPPQKPAFEMSSYSISDMDKRSTVQGERRQHSTDATLDDDDFLDVIIGFERTEGCTSILVEQTDSDWPIPYTYFVNPSDGCFTAYMIRQYPSSFKLTYVNNKGQTQSQSKVIDLSSTRERTLMAETHDDNTTLHYTLSGGSNDESFSGTYSIVDLNTFRTVGQGEISGPTGDIDVSRLSNGLYSFSIRDSRNKLYSTKWNKQL